MGVSMMLLFPLSFLSNILVDPATVPGRLQGFVDVDPVTRVVAAVRGLMGGDLVAGDLVWVAVACALLVGVFGTLTMRAYNRK